MKKKSVVALSAKGNVKKLKKKSVVARSAKGKVKKFNIETGLFELAVECLEIGKRGLSKLSAMTEAERMEEIAGAGEVVNDSLLPIMATRKNGACRFDDDGWFKDYKLLGVGYAAKGCSEEVRGLFNRFWAGWVEYCEALKGLICACKANEAAVLLPGVLCRAQDCFLVGKSDCDDFENETERFEVEFRRATLKPLKDCPRPDGFSDFEISVFKEVEDRHDEGMGWKEAWAYVEDSHGGKVPGHTPAVWARRERDYRGEAGISVGGQGKKKRRRKRYK